MSISGTVDILEQKMPQQNAKKGLMMTMNTLRPLKRAASVFYSIFTVDRMIHSTRRECVQAELKLALYKGTRHNSHTASVQQ